MRFPSKIFVIAVLACVTTLAACGGSSDSPPGPLSKHFDDMYIARISPADKPDVQRTQQDWSLARAENAKAEADLSDLELQLSVVRNDQKAAHLQVDSAVTSKKSADASADTNRINEATKNLHTAEDVAKAADARVKYFEAIRGYMKRQVRYTQEVMYWREAQYELAKAQTGQKNGIAPKGISYDEFPRQEQDRSKRQASAKSQLDSEKQRVMSVRENWLRAQETADRESGRTGALPDPMAPKGS
ncbi:MAG TPA: hypothetical protein VFT22_30380 [Kofleriaceae bacterium]|nr:hypothetical protein [Kofleriaceae bacterium]